MRAGPIRRPVGLETEFGVLRPGEPGANAVEMSTQIVGAYADISRQGLTDALGDPAPPAHWDYEGEDPLADLRGGRLARAAAHPSQLTDNPWLPAPSPDADPGLTDSTGVDPGARIAPGGSAGSVGSGPDQARPPWGMRPRPSVAEAALPRAAGAVLTNGARLYVDHAHPEYSSPEVLTPRDALIWDRAGEVIARRAMEAHARAGGPGGEIVLYKNNVDGKGAAYGSHENYLLQRDLPLEDIARVLTPFLVTRPIIAGAGRVGIGQRSQTPGFQISQRADYVESPIGLQTTFNRPIINTRDEPHADARRWRRLHVINGDANRFDVPIYLKVASTSLVLWCLERLHSRGEGLGPLARLELSGDAVAEQWALSHDTSLRHELATVSGPRSALDIQRAFLYAVRQAIAEEQAQDHEPLNGGVTASGEVMEALDLWLETLDALEQWAADGTGAAPALVEWVAKLELCQGLRARTGSSWADPRLAALDIQWADLRPGRSVIHALDAAGRIRRLVTPQEVEAAADSPPSGTRAAIRGAAIAQHAAVVGASWTSVVLDLPGRPDLMRLALPDSVAVTADETAAMNQEIGRATRPGGD